MAAFEQTDLWKSSLAERDNDPHRSERETLRVAYLQFRKNIQALVAHIQSSAPELTVHDITHLDRLWETADLIAGPTYPMNAMEGFVFGGAVLLHDAALCFEAYDGGLHSVRSTIAWRDAFAFEDSSGLEIDEAKRNADFTALRSLHAEQAEVMLDRTWTDVDGGTDFYLLENRALKQHLGNVIGKIAASHHWSIERVSSTFSRQLNAPTDYPMEWRVDPVKIACMLRSADAGHFYNDRAPDFLRALLKRSGISADHWKSQNWITRLDTDLNDPSRESIVFTSSRPFGPEDRSAWWVAADAVDVLNKEILSSNDLLKERSLLDSPVFLVKRVTGAGSPSALAKCIETVDWTPFPVSLHVSNVESLVESLGGENLYGSNLGKDNLEVALRELIQNSVDAIHARSEMLEPGYQPKIEICIRNITEDGHECVWLDVKDNGVGMSERVLTGPFLDFGTSFWATNLLHSEFPGLRASKFRPVGRFGIGFFSVFMAAEEVIVTTRPFESARDATMRMVFSDGSKFRPLFLSGAFANALMSVSTTVSLRLKSQYKDFVEDVEITRNVMGVPNIKTEFQNYIVGIAPGIDVPIDINIDGEVEEVFGGHPLSNTSDVAGWLTAMSYARGQQDYSNLAVYIEDAASRAEPIIESDRLVGFAALSSSFGYENSCLCAPTVGGLTHSAHSRSGTPYVGFIERQPASAKRDVGSYVASEETLKNWCESQFQKLRLRGLGPMQRLMLPYQLAEFKVDPIDVALISVTIPTSESDGRTGASFVDVHQCANLLSTHDIGFFTMTDSNWVDRAQSFSIDKVIVSPMTNGAFSQIEIEDGSPTNNFGMADCIHRAALSLGYQPKWKKESSNVRSKFGLPMDLWVCSIK